MVGILVSFWDGLFSGAMLVSGRVCLKIFPCDQEILAKKLVADQFGHCCEVPSEHFSESTVDRICINSVCNQVSQIMPSCWVFVAKRLPPPLITDNHPLRIDFPF